MPVDFSQNIFYEPSFQFYDPKLLQAVHNRNEQVWEFFRLLALCHTVMCEERENGKIVYQAQSPDEAALTSAARNFGFVFRVSLGHSNDSLLTTERLKMKQKI